MNEKELLAILLREKTPEEILELEVQLLISRLSELLHTLLCPHDHETDCSFYKEEICTAPSPERTAWVQRTERLLSNAQVEGKEGIEEILQYLPKLAPLLVVPEVIQFIAVILPPLLTRAKADRDVPLGPPDACPSGPSGSVVPLKR